MSRGAAMSPSESAPTVAEIRDAVAESVSSTSLRQVAREVGMAPSGLRKFLDGSRPYTATRRKLHRWYVREGHTDTTPFAARSALDVVVADLPPRHRADALRGMLESLRERYGRAKEPVPEWLAQLLDELG